MSLHRRGLLLLAVIAVLAGLLQVVPSASAAGASGSEFVGVTPVRVADTRDGTGSRIGKVAVGQVLTVPVAGTYGVPGDAVAVSLNVTVTQPAAGGYVTVFPCGQPRPLASNLNFTAGRTVPNAVVVKPGSGGAVCLYASATTHLLADLNGYFPGTAVYEGMVPVRAADTRDGTGVARAKVGAGQTLDVPVAGRFGIAADATSVAANVTVTGPDSGGYVTVWPCGEPRPVASNLNFSKGQTIANAVIAGVGSGGAVCLYTTAATHLIVDVGGYFTDAADYWPLVPERAFDTRKDWDRTKLPAGWEIRAQAAEPGELAAAVLNVTVTGPNGSGYITVYPCNEGLPLSSNLNFVRGQTVPNMVIAPVDSDGYVCFYTSATTHLLADINGVIPIIEPEQFQAEVVDAGGGATCALDAAGTAWCWGDDRDGTVGDGADSVDFKPLPSPVASTLVWRDIMVGQGDQACAVSTDGELWCWGRGYDGPTLESRHDSPVRVPGLPAAVVDVSASHNVTCAVEGQGQAWCWGDGRAGELGDGRTTTVENGFYTYPSARSPVPVAGDHTFVQIAAGGSHVCALGADGSAWCWGSNGDGQLGSGGDDFISWTPVPVAGEHTFTQVTAGGRHTCALDAEGVAWCWGWDEDGQLGDGPGQDSPEHRTPVAVDTQERFASIDAGGEATCAVTIEQEARCWGSDVGGALGDGTIDWNDYRVDRPAPVTGGLAFDTVRTSGGHTCGVTVDRLAFCWGDPMYGGFRVGRLGNGAEPQERAAVPTPVLAPSQ